MNKKMFIFCIIFLLIISCNNYSGDKNLKNIKNHLENEVKGFLDTKNGIKEELGEDFGNFGTEFVKLVQDVRQLHGQVEDKIAQGVVRDSKLEEKIEKKVQELKEEI
ncbi:hypothetical protein [Borreliella valaisiana]|uniref:hypothetical protein n=1 Tax=Borreliella valaisiana TaxID=62088 RepID=UPI002ED42240|nr:hypothetical protein KJD09_04370 [Borreliella valaisiana]